MRLIDADALIGELHTTFLYDDNARKVIYRKIEEAPTVGGWISVKDRLPPNDATKVLTYGNPVTYWMPLPEPPEEVSGDD